MSVLTKQYRYEQDVYGNWILKEVDSNPFVPQYSYIPIQYPYSNISTFDYTVQ